MSVATPPVSPPRSQESRILLSQAREGMVLSRGIELPNRTRLCPSGTVLTPALIQRLGVRGIKRLYVVGVPLPNLHADQWANARDRFDERFSRVRNQPYLMAVGQAILTAMARRF